jgi:hypothetical protein
LEVDAGASQCWQRIALGFGAVWIGASSNDNRAAVKHLNESVCDQSVINLHMMAP